MFFLELKVIKNKKGKKIIVIFINLFFIFLSFKYSKIYILRKLLKYSILFIQKNRSIDGQKLASSKTFRSTDGQKLTSSKTFRSIDGQKLTSSKTFRSFNGQKLTLSFFHSKEFCLFIFYLKRFEKNSNNNWSYKTIS